MTLIEELIEIGHKIDEGECSYGELAYLQDHKQAVLDYGDIHLCEQAGITEEEFNNGKLNPELSFEEDFIKLELDKDEWGNVLARIILDDEKELYITEDELIGLKRIFDYHYSEIQDYFEKIYQQFKDR